MNLNLYKFICTFCFVTLSGCTYGPPEVHSRIVNVSRPPGRHIIGVMVARQELRQPTGLSEFPDGGSPKILSQEAIIYLCDIDSGSIKRLHAYRDDGGQELSFEPWIVGWKGDSLFFSTTGCSPNSNHECSGSLRKTKYFEIGISDGKSRIVDRVPDGVVLDANSPLSPNIEEQNYLRHSNNQNTVDVTTTDAKSFHPAFKLSDDGQLSVIGNGSN